MQVILTPLCDDLDATQGYSASFQIFNRNYLCLFAGWGLLNMRM